jgi:CHAT domain-containing protein
LLCGLSEAVDEFPPLPGVPGELKAIQGTIPNHDALQDAGYTIPNLIDRFRSEDYAALHLATHGVFGGDVDETFLVAYDGRLSIAALQRLIGLGRYRTRKVELLTLSACQTALGNERAALGLGGVAVQAGVRSAVATLWYIDDEAAGRLIRAFYRELGKPGVRKADALRQAQMSLISQARYRHPAYWSPFLLIGNWR